MSDPLSWLERVARVAGDLGTGRSDREEQAHAFDERNIHPEISRVCLKLFDDGHYSQATFEAFKYLDLEVKNASKVNDSGFKLMMTAFDQNNPKIKLTPLSSISEIDEQLGYRHIFAGVMSAIRNPRGHEIRLDSLEACLDHLSIASVLLRRLESRIP